jgi:hypothetical protein
MVFFGIRLNRARWRQVVVSGDGKICSSSFERSKCSFFFIACGGVLGF